MRSHLRNLRAILACCATTAAIALCAGPAVSKPETPTFMPLGEAAPAPLGYLDFCARRPDQCGLQMSVDAAGAPLSVDDLKRQLTSQYYWGVAFAQAHAEAPPSIPTAGASDPFARPLATPPASNARSQVDAQLTPAVGTSLQPSPWPEASLSDASLSEAVVISGATVVASDPQLDLRTALTDTDRPVLEAPAAGAPASYLVGASSADVGVAFPDSPRDRLASAAQLTFAPPGDLTQIDPEAMLGGGVAVLANIGEVPAPQRLILRLSDTTADQTNPAAPTPGETARSDEQPSSAPPPLVASVELMSELNSVNQRINHAIRYVPDQDLYGDEDYWHLALDPGMRPAGDCKDYVLEKRRALVADGIPAGDLSIAIVQTNWGETHAVLLVTTENGELVLDSLTGDIKPWQKAHYRWVERQAPGEQLNWVRLDRSGRTRAAHT